MVIQKTGQRIKAESLKKKRGGQVETTKSTGLVTKEKGKERKVVKDSVNRTEERVEQEVIRAKVMPSQKERVHSVGTVITVASKVIQPSSAWRPRSSILSVIIVARKVSKQRTAEVPKGQESEDKKERVMECMRLYSTCRSTWNKIKGHQWDTKMMEASLTAVAKSKQS